MDAFSIRDISYIVGKSKCNAVEMLWYVTVCVVFRLRNIIHPKMNARATTKSTRRRKRRRKRKRMIKIYKEWSEKIDYVTPRSRENHWVVSAKPRNSYFRSQLIWALLPLAFHFVSGYNVWLSFNIFIRFECTQPWIIKVWSVTKAPGRQFDYILFVISKLFENRMGYKIHFSNVSATTVLVRIDRLSIIFVKCLQTYGNVWNGGHRFKCNSKSVRNVQTWHKIYVKSTDH